MHIGKNIRKLRDFREIKQETVARELNMTQQNYSRIEQLEDIEDEMLQNIARIIGYPVDVIKNLEQEGTQNIFNSGTIDNSIFQQYNTNKELIDLYERMIQLQKENAALLEQLQQKANK